MGHANIAIASSGVIGKGPGNSTERDYLPQAFSDFIYAIIIEEMGIIGAVVVVFLYIILLYRCARIASRCENNFPAFLVMGLSSDSGRSGMYQHDGGCRDDACHRTAITAYIEGRHIDHHQLCLYRCHSQREPFGKDARGSNSKNLKIHNKEHEDKN